MYGDDAETTRPPTTTRRHSFPQHSSPFSPTTKISRYLSFTSSRHHGNHHPHPHLCKASMSTSWSYTHKDSPGAVAVVLKMFETVGRRVRAQVHTAARTQHLISVNRVTKRPLPRAARLQPMGTQEKMKDPLKID